MAWRFQFLCLVLLSAAIIIPTRVLAGCGSAPDSPKSQDELSKMITRSKIRLEAFEGKWEADYKHAIIAVFDEDGKETAICRDTLPKECDAALGTGHATYSFRDGMIQYSYIHLQGIITVEESKKEFPECAKEGIYPKEFKLEVPESHTVSYNPFNGDLSYHDSRRPDHTECFVAFYDWNDEGAQTKNPKAGYLLIKQAAKSDVTFGELMKGGVISGCECPPDKCGASITEDGKINLEFSNEFKLLCKDKTCKGPSPPVTTTESSSVVV